MFKNIFLLNCVILLSIMQINAQNNDAIIDKAYYKKCISRAKAEKKRGATTINPFIPINRTFELTINLVHSDSTQLGINAAITEIQKGVDITNQYFAPTGVKFVITKHFYDPDTASFTEFASSDDADSEKGKLKKELIARYFEPNTINIYYLPKIGGGASGFSPCPGGTNDNGIFIEHASFANNVLVHEMGHFFGLHHPFEGWNGPGNFSNSDFVDGHNCEITGDLVCDTPAEPDMSYNDLKMVSSDCLYDDILGLKDPAGKFYIPSVTNIMSYGNNGCVCGFTNGQFVRMHTTYLDKLQHLR